MRELLWNGEGFEYIEIENNCGLFINKCLSWSDIVLLGKFKSELKKAKESK